MASNLRPGAAALGGGRRARFEEQARTAERAAELAAMPVQELFAAASDAELRAEALRVSRAFETPRREWRVGHAHVLQNLDAGLARLPAFADAALAAVKREALAGPPTPTTLIQAVVALDGARPNANLTDKLRKALAPDGEQIVKGDPRGDASRERRALDERRAAIGMEIERRDIERRRATLATRAATLTKKETK